MDVAIMLEGQNRLNWPQPATVRRTLMTGLFFGRNASEVQQWLQAALAA